MQLNSSLATLIVSKNFTRRLSTNKYTSIKDDIPDGYTPISVVSLLEWDNLYLVKRNGNDWCVFGGQTERDIDFTVYFLKIN